MEREKRKAKNIEYEITSMKVTQPVCTLSVESRDYSIEPYGFETDEMENGLSSKATL